MKEVDCRYALGIQNVNTRAIKVLCPYHDDTSPSMAVYADGTKCFSCGATESPETFLRRMEVDPETLPEISYEEHRKQRPNSRTYTPGPDTEARVAIYHDILMDRSSPRFRKIDWFLERGIFWHTIRRYKLGHTGTAFVIPVWYGEELTGIRYRLDDEFHTPDEMKRMKYFPETGQPALIYRPTPRQGLPFITEGELDALALSQYGFDAITTTGGSDSLHLELTPQRLRLVSPVVAVDMDEAGDIAYHRLCEVWGEPLRRLHMPEGMDVSKWLLSIETMNKRDYIEELLKGE